MRCAGNNNNNNNNHPVDSTERAWTLFTIPERQSEDGGSVSESELCISNISTPPSVWGKETDKAEQRGLLSRSSPTPHHYPTTATISKPTQNPTYTCPEEDTTPPSIMNTISSYGQRSSSSRRTVPSATIQVTGKTSTCPPLQQPTPRRTTTNVGVDSRNRDNLPRHNVVCHRTTACISLSLPSLHPAVHDKLLTFAMSRPEPRTPSILAIQIQTHTSYS